MTWRLPDNASWAALRVRAAGWLHELLRECRLEWRSRPLIRHLSALALCLFVVLVGVLERSTKRVSTATTMEATGRTVATRAVPVAEARAPETRRTGPAMGR